MAVIEKKLRWILVASFALSSTYGVFHIYTTGSILEGLLLAVGGGSFLMLAIAIFLDTFIGK